jgi:hypothetical protein
MKHHDEESDVLYVKFGDKKPCRTVEADVCLRVDETVVLMA